MVGKYCSKCGTECMQSMRVCPSCGSESFSANAPTEKSLNVSKPIGLAPVRASSGKDLDGVAGWLLFFVITLTIITPIWSAYIIVSEIPGLKLLGAGGFKTLLIFNLVMVGAIGLFSLLSGALLWSRHPKAVSYTKIFLVTQAAVTVGMVVILMFYISPDPKPFIKPVLQSLVYLGAWMTYVQKSVRVKNTYNL